MHGVDREELKRMLLELLREDEEFRYAVHPSGVSVVEAL